MKPSIALFFLRSGLCLSTALAVGGCDAPRPAWKSEGVRYYADPEDGGACEEVMPRLLAYRNEVADFLGVSTPAKMSYYKYRDFWQFQQSGACSSGVAGCFKPILEIVHSRYPLDRHELVHEVDRHSASDVFDEAFSTALSCAPSEPFVNIEREALAIPLSSPRYDSYEAWAAVFTELLRRGTVQELQRLEASFEALGGDYDAFEEALGEVYALSLDELWEEIEEAGKSTCVPIGRCDQPAVEFGLNTVVDACDGLHERVFDDSLAPAVGISTGESEAYFIACDLQAPPWAYQSRYLRSLNREIVVQPPRSPHLLTRPSTSVEETSISVRKVEGVFGASCASVRAKELALGPLSGQTIVLSHEPGDYWFHIAQGKAAIDVGLGVGRFSGLGPGYRAWLCESCPMDVEAECERLTYTGSRAESFYLLVRVEEGSTRGPNVYLELEHPE